MKKIYFILSLIFILKLSSFAQSSGGSYGGYGSYGSGGYGSYGSGGSGGYGSYGSGGSGGYGSYGSGGSGGYGSYGSGGSGGYGSYGSGGSGGYGSYGSGGSGGSGGYGSYGSGGSGGYGSGGYGSYGGGGGCITGCEDPTACNYDPTATCAGTCSGKRGCTSTSYCNYDPNANCDDGSCNGSAGCTVSASCNYNAAATCDDGSCVPFVIPSVAVSYSPNIICFGSTVTFTASTVHGGLYPTYQWVKNGNAVGFNNNTYIDNSLNNNDSVWLVMTSDTTCAMPGPDTSNISYIIVDSAFTPQVSINASQANICHGVPVTFTASAVYGGTLPTYEWYLDGNAVGTNSSVYVDSTINDNDGIWAVMISNALCTAPDSAVSNSVLMTVSPSTAPTISISGSTVACAGSPVTFSSSTTYGGVIPVYQWQVNGANAGSNSSSFTSSSLQSGDAVSCILTSNQNCAVPATVASNSINIASVMPDSAPTVSISGSNTICAGSQATFTANATYGGNAPGYQWQVNGAPAGANNDAFSSSTLSNGDALICVLTSNANCASPTTASSNTININVTALPSTPVITLNLATLSSNAANGNQWYLNGVLIQGATSQTYSPQEDGVYQDIVTIDNCSSDNSNSITVTKTGIENVGNSDIKIYPNPANDVLYIQSAGSVITTIEVINMVGQTIAVNTVNQNFYRLAVSNLAQGNYLLLLHTSDGVANKLITIVRE